jgi:hypothetical protein
MFGLLGASVELVVRAGDEIVVTAGLEASDDGRARQSAMSSDVNRAICFHILISLQKYHLTE